MMDLHMHTVFSDGKDTPEEMVQEAIRLGLETVGISDHSHLDPCGMTIEGSAEYRREIARLKEKYAGKIRVLCGLERDFISDDFAPYDYVIGSWSMNLVIRSKCPMISHFVTSATLASVA